MIRYIGLDRALSEFEPSVRRLEIILDKWEQEHLDEIRGNRVDTAQTRRPDSSSARPATVSQTSHY
jgi:hypothetical protein